MIYFQFVSENSIGSTLIGWFSAGHLSHVDALMPTGMLLGARIGKGGAAEAGVQLRKPGYANFSKRVVFKVPTSDEQEDAFYGFLHAQLGKPYDWRSILAFALGRDWREDDSWYCSELQARALEVSGILSSLYLASNKITPVALALVLSAVKGVKIT